MMVAQGSLAFLYHRGLYVCLYIPPTPAIPAVIFLLVEYWVPVLFIVYVFVATFYVRVVFLALLVACFAVCTLAVDLMFARASSRA